MQWRHQTMSPFSRLRLYLSIALVLFLKHIESGIHIIQFRWWYQCSWFIQHQHTVHFLLPLNMVVIHLSPAECYLQLWSLEYMHWMGIILITYIYLLNTIWILFCQLEFTYQLDFTHLRLFLVLNVHFLNLLQIQDCLQVPPCLQW